MPINGPDARWRGPPPLRVWGITAVVCVLALAILAGAAIFGRITP